MARAGPAQVHEEQYGKEMERRLANDTLTLSHLGSQRCCEEIFLEVHLRDCQCGPSLPPVCETSQKVCSHSTGLGESALVRLSEQGVNR